MIGIINVNFTTIVQESTPPELRGRVMGLLATVAGSLTPSASPWAASWAT